MPAVGGPAAAVLGGGARLHPSGRRGSGVLLPGLADGHLCQLQVSCQPAQSIRRESQRYAVQLISFINV